MFTIIAITDKEFSRLSNYIKLNYGIYLKPEKKALVTGRLNNVLERGGFNNFNDYCDYVISDKSGRAIVILIDKITTNHTFFMRESDHFFYFRDVVLPSLVSNLKNHDLRIWCAACSTGEESYTLAMLIDEFFGKDKGNWDTKVLATDISERVLRVAKEGKYRKESITLLPPYWKLNYFNKTDFQNCVISDKIRNEVIYRKFNLMDQTFPFKKKLHIIFCRNVMIYFDNKTKIDLVEKFYDSMEYGGYLFIGHSESLIREYTRFKYIRPSVYRKE